MDYKEKYQLLMLDRAELKMEIETGEFEYCNQKEHLIAFLSYVEMQLSLMRKMFLAMNYVDFEIDN